MNEITKKLMMSLMTLVLVFVISACSSDNDKDEPEEDYATNIVGTYTGQLTSGGYVIEDVYVVTIAKISNKAVSVSAKLFSDNSANFNVSYKNGVYTLESANQSNMTATIQQKSLTISYLNQAGTMTTFSGSRD